MNDIASPCIKICRMDINDICIGCRRTRDEIGNWSKYTNEQKQDVLDRASNRRVVEENTGGFSF